MAAQQTNPVLEVLGEQVDQLRQEVKYPAEPLDFQQGSWRAFYHCHAVPDNGLEEHGHFHLFIQHQEHWVHLAALSMDKQGQPQAWIAVNRWVTDGPWLAEPELRHALQNAEYAFKELSLLESWLLAMVQVFRLEIMQLLVERDEMLRQINKKNDESVLLDDREIYTLATHNIDLLSKLKDLYA